MIIIIKKLKKKAGYLYIEILSALLIFAIFCSSVSVFTIESLGASGNATRRIEAMEQLKELNNAVMFIKNSSWSTIKNNTGVGNVHINYTNYNYTLLSSTETINGYTRYLSIGNVYRDTNGNIVTTGGTLDSHTRAITATVSWNDTLGHAKSISSISYVNDWNLAHWTDSLVADFQLGTKNNTIITNNVDGEVQLNTIYYADWCRPQLSTTTVNLSGQGVPTTISAVPNSIAAGTGGNASGVPFVHISLNNAVPPTATVTGTIASGFKTNQIFRDSNYAYISTDSNQQPIKIVSGVTSSTPTVVGYFSAPQNAPGGAITASGGYGYMTQSTKFYIFDLSSPTGSRPLVNTGSVPTLAGSGNKIRILGNYAYVSTSSSTTQLQIIDISNKVSPTIVGSLNIPSASTGTGVDINTDGTRAYVVTAYSVSKSSFWIVDTTTKSSPTLISGGNLQLGGMSPKDVSFAQYTTTNNASYVIVVGTGGSTQYQAVRILSASEGSPTVCGGISVTNGVNAISAGTDGVGNVYSYIATNQTSAELQIIQGGPEVGNGQGNGYIGSGTFTSQYFDTKSTTTYLDSEMYDVTIPANTTFSVQIRSGNTLTECAANSWYGPDGTSNTYFTNGTTLTSIPRVLTQGTRYLQYILYFTSDPSRVYTPVFSDITIYYQT